MTQGLKINVDRGFSSGEIEKVAEEFPFECLSGEAELLLDSKEFPKKEEEIWGYLGWCEVRGVTPFSTQTWVYDPRLACLCPSVGESVFGLGNKKIWRDKKEVLEKIARSMIDGARTHQIAVRSGQLQYRGEERFPPVYALIKDELISKGYKISDLGISFRTRPTQSPHAGRMSLHADLNRGIWVNFWDIPALKEDEEKVERYLRTFGEPQRA